MEYVYTNFNDDFKLKHAEEEGEEEEDSKKERRIQHCLPALLLLAELLIGLVGIGDW